MQHDPWYCHFGSPPHSSEPLEGSFSAVSTPVLQPNTHIEAFVEVYKICILLHRSKFRSLAFLSKVLHLFAANLVNFANFKSNSLKRFSTNRSLDCSIARLLDCSITRLLDCSIVLRLSIVFDEILSEFHEI